MTTASKINLANILVVDDDIGVLYSTAKLLTLHNYQVATASNAEEALKQVKNRRFDLVVCDINMPGRSGLDFLNDLKRIDPTTASVVMTSNGTVTTAIQAMRSGALGFVIKPYNEKELFEAIEIAITQARQLREALEMEFYTPMLESLCDALLNTMEAGEYSNPGSSRRVAKHAQEIAQAYGLDDEEAYQIYLAGLFHDIGKIGVPDEIVRKSVPLTPEEEMILNQHPELGSRIVAQTHDMEKAALIVRHHLEAYDGSGVPSGLRGENIPLGSRILAVASAYEELTAQRHYTPGLSHQEALISLQADAGIRYDPRIVELALTILKPAGRAEHTTVSTP
jgi:putative two-component system response regulator